MKLSMLKLVSAVAAVFVAVAQAEAVPFLPDVPDTAALATVDRFMEAWRMRNQTEGLAMCSPSLRQRIKDEDLRMEISGLSNPHHAAYEVGDGKVLPHGRVMFQVRLYESYTGVKDNHVRPRRERIVAVNAGHGRWLIDQLP